MRLTPNEVALIASGLTTLMAIVTVRSNRRSTKDTLQHQREMAHDERVWRERAELYVDLINWARQTTVMSMKYIEDLNRPPARRPTQAENDEGRLMQSRATALASHEVRELLEAKRDAAARVITWNVEHAGQGLAEQLKPEYQALTSALAEADEELFGQIRRELRTGYAEEVPPNGRRRLARIRLPRLRTGS